MNRQDRDEWLNLLLATRVEPELGRDRRDRVPLPRRRPHWRGVNSPHGYEVAERFELYCRGIEIGQRIPRTRDARELRARFEKVNAARVADGRRALPLPKSSFAHWNTDCRFTGVGWESNRLVMLAIGAESIDDVVAFPQLR